MNKYRGIVYVPIEMEADSEADFEKRAKWHVSMKGLVVQAVTGIENLSKTPDVKFVREGDAGWSGPTATITEKMGGE